MYICNECKTVFDDIDREVINTIDYYQEYGSVCPHCRSDQFEEAVYCPVCDEYYTYDDFDGYNEETSKKPWYHHEGDICRKCVEEIFTPELAMEFLKDYELEKEFYIEVIYDAEVKHAGFLLYLCKTKFIEELKYSRESRTEDLKQFTFDNLNLFSEWYLDKYVYGKKEAV